MTNATAARSHKPESTRERTDVTPPDPTEYVRCLPAGSAAWRPRATVEVHVGEQYPDDFSKVDLADLDELIDDLTAARSWLAEQDF